MEVPTTCRSRRTYLCVARRQVSQETNGKKEVKRIALRVPTSRLWKR